MMMDLLTKSSYMIHVVPSLGPRQYVSFEDLHSVQPFKSAFIMYMGPELVITVTENVLGT